MPTATDFVFAVKGTPIQNDGTFTDVSFLIDQSTDGLRVPLSRRKQLKVMVTVPTLGSSIGDFIAVGDTLRVYISQHDAWDNLLEMYAYTSSVSVTTANKLTRAGASVGQFNTFTMTQAFIDELVVVEYGSDFRFAMRITAVNLTGSSKVSFTSLDDTFTPAAGTKNATASVIASVIAGAQGGAKRPGSSIPGLEAAVIATAVGSKVGATIPGAASVIASVTAIATGGRVGGILIDNETSKVLSVSQQSLSFTSTGTEWRIVH